MWIAKCLYEPTGQLKQRIETCWFHPPLEPKPSPPEPGWLLLAEVIHLGTNEDVGDSFKMPSMFPENEQLWDLQKGQGGD